LPHDYGDNRLTVNLRRNLFIW